ncbi:MAG TPA: type II CAAX endopeptidase family protein [Anaerolineaceae bacterium]|nr:type II CAAX endopeptidase family protein [Anaerolineaceae bacterium]
MTNKPGRRALIYLAALTIAEAFTTIIEARVGMILHGLILVFIFLDASLWSTTTQRRFLMCLALAPIIRLCSLSLPLPNFPFIYWYMVVGIPLLIAAFFTARVGRMSRGMIGLTLRKWPLQLIAGLVGFGFGYVEYLILHPEPLVSKFDFVQILLPSFILLFFTGFLEELIFRGLMQYAALRSLGRVGFFYVALVFSVLHFGYHSVLNVLFVLGVALIFGWFSYSTGSILGVALAHGLTNIGLFLIFPFLIAAPSMPPVELRVILIQTPGIHQLPTLVTSTIPPPTQEVLPPGLLAPVATLEETRPWIPPTNTLLPSPFIPHPSATPIPALTDIPAAASEILPTAMPTDIS